MGPLLRPQRSGVGVAVLFPSPRTKAAEYKQHLPEGKGLTQRRVGGGGLFPWRKAASEGGAPFPVLGLGRSLRQPHAPARFGVRLCRPAARRGKAAPDGTPTVWATGWAPSPTPMAVTTPTSAAAPHLQSSGAASILVGVGTRSAGTAAATQQAPPRSRAGSLQSVCGHDPGVLTTPRVPGLSVRQA